MTLNNHTSGSLPIGATNVVWTYDDNGEGDVTIANGYPGHIETNRSGATTFPQDWMHTDGPGTLQDFAGKKALGVWMYTQTDSALTHTGQVNMVHGWIDVHPPTNVLHRVVTIAGNGWFYDFLQIPDDATNLIINVTYNAGTGPVDLYVRKDFFPNTTNYDAAATNILAPGGFLSVTNPPLSGGFWVYGIHNDSGTPVTLTVDIQILENLTPELVETLTNNAGSVLLDDAITRSQILITKALPVVSVEVGLRLDHPRLSDLSIQLISPQGTHVMLFEDRGRNLATQLGLDTTSNTVYTIFTEDTNKASGLIKFALPPYSLVDATTTNKIISSNGFDDLAENFYPAGSVIDGWMVLTNQASVEYEPELNTSPLNYLALGSAAITQTLPTQTGKTYLLHHTYHGPNIFDWWTADGNAKDIINPTNSGTFTNLDGSAPLYTAGEVGEAWHFNGTNTEVIINTNACNFGTNDFTIEFWLQTVGTNIMAVMEKWPECDANKAFWEIRIGRSGFNNVGAAEIAMEVSADNIVNDTKLLSTNAHINDGQWHHVAFRRDEAELDVYIDGVLNNFTIAPDIAFISNNVPFVMGHSICQGRDGTMPFAGNLDEVSVFHRSVSPGEIYDIWAAGHAGKRSTTSVLPNITYLIDGKTNDVLVSDIGNTNFVTGPGDPWQTNFIGFTATNNGTQFTIAGNPLSMLLDDIVLEELPNTNYHNYFLPEESLSAFAGEIAAGLWTLEIHDTRTNQTGVLLDWELNLTYSSTNVNLIVLQPGECTNVTAPANGFVYFAADVPLLAKFATNTLNNVGPQPLNLIFNQTALPTGTSAGDFYLLAGETATGVSVLSKSFGPPFLESGKRYFLAVQNTTGTDQKFCMQVDFDVKTNSDITSLDDPPVAGSLITTNVLAGTTQYYYYDISNSSVTASFEILNPTADVDMVITHTLPLPDQYHYDYGSFNSDTNDEFIVVHTNSQPVTLTPGRWYIGVFNSITNPPNVTYTIRAQQNSGLFNIYSLNAPNANPRTGQTNSPGFSLDGGGTPTYYSFTLSNNEPAVEFVISNLSGNCDLLARLDNLPTPAQFDYGSFNAGNANERIVITTNASLPSLNGTWYLAVADNGQGPTETFDIAASILPVGSTPFPLIASAGYSSANGGSFSFTWSAVAGQTYYVEMSTNLVNWDTLGKVTANSNTASFTDAQPPDTARYYRLRTPQ